MRCIDAPPGADSVLPQKYVAAGVTIIMAEPQALAWINALTSGKYQQARMTLCDDDGGFCCLGVEQDVNYGMVEVARGPDSSPTMWHLADYEGYPTSVYLKYTRKAYFDSKGMLDCSPTLQYKNEPGGKGVWRSASNLNDDNKLPFPVIAELLRKHMAVYTPLPEDLVRHDTK